MLHEVIAPKTGMYDGPVTVVSWLVPEGTMVTKGDVLFEIETEKVSSEVPAEDDGMLRITVPAGETVAIGSVIGLLAETQSEYEQLLGDTR